MDETRAEDRFVMAMVITACSWDDGAQCLPSRRVVPSTLLQEIQQRTGAELISEQYFDEVLVSHLQRCRRCSKPSMQRGTPVTGEAPHLARARPLRGTDRLDQTALVEFL